MSDNTVYALSTAAGKSGVAVFRVSGSDALAVVRCLTALDAGAVVPRHAYFTSLHDLAGEVLDHALVLYFKAPASFTGEDTVEIHSHGSRAVIAAVLENLGRLDGFRLAEPGEFSKRAFYNGKMDLTEAEGLADLIDAETREQQKYALRQMEGGLKNLYDGWREKLVEILAYLEAYIDFPDEELPSDLVDKLENTVFKVNGEIAAHLGQNNAGERLREGFRVVIAGEPNAGKSSLLNALARREAVIVSDIAGTTRDVIKESVEIKGIKLNFLDTAGIRDSGYDEIEKIGIEKSRAAVKTADVVIFLSDATVDGEKEKDLLSLLDGKKSVIAVNKSDIGKYEKDGINICAKTGENVDKLLEKVIGLLDNDGMYEKGIITNERHIAALKECVGLINDAIAAYEIMPSECIAVDIYAASSALGRITGKSVGDDVIDEIFSRFCVGK